MPMESARKACMRGGRTSGPVLVDCIAGCESIMSHFNRDAIERKSKICDRVVCLRTLWVDSFVKAARSSDMVRIIRSITNGKVDHKLDKENDEPYREYVEYAFATYCRYSVLCFKGE